MSKVLFVQCLYEGMNLGGYVFRNLLMVWLKIITWKLRRNDGVWSRGFMHEITTRIYKIVVRFIVLNVHFIRCLVRLSYWMWRIYLKLEIWYPTNFSFIISTFSSSDDYSFISYVIYTLGPIYYFCVLFYGRLYKFDAKFTVLTNLSISRVVCYVCTYFSINHL